MSIYNGERERTKKGGRKREREGGGGAKDYVGAHAFNSLQLNSIKFNFISIFNHEREARSPIRPGPGPALEALRPYVYKALWYKMGYKKT